jgi:acyl transferase domain-containing protein
MNVRGGHFLKSDINSIDAPFFSISREEAIAMDSQQKGMLECSYLALGNGNNSHPMDNALSNQTAAGIPIEKIAGSQTAVFTGSFCNDAKTNSVKDNEFLSPYAASATALCMLANRLSWWYNFKGPSMNIDTACSSGLVALHLACMSLHSGESSMASTHLIISDPFADNC